jgi:hypothetical protein
MGEKETGKIKKSRAKIIVTTDDELTDLLRKISALDDENILLTFAEESDLLISPINLKVLQEVCDELKKNLILQIIQNPTGVRNAKIAGIIITESPSDVEEDLWLIASKKRMERIEERNFALKRGKGEERDVKEAIKSLEHEPSPVLQDSEYQDRVQKVIEKSKDLIENDNKKIIEEDDWTFAIGQDIGEDKEKNDLGKEKDGIKPSETKQHTLVGRNFNNIDELKKINEKGFKIPKFTKKEKPEVEKSVKKEKEKKDKKPRVIKGLKKKLLLLSAIILVSLGLTALFAYFTLPTVEAEIYIESKSVEIEKTLTGTTSITELNLDEREIPLRKEEIIITRSEHAETTGTGTRGSKAEGVVVLNNWDREEEEDIVIPAGTILTSPEGLKFELTREGILDPQQPLSMPARAIENGDKYNLIMGTKFTVEKFPDIGAENFQSFSGGLSEEYSKLTKGDYDKLLKTLKEDAFDSGMTQLEERADGWELIEDSVKQELDGNPNTDIPVDGEGSVFNMNLSTTTEGLYFNKQELLDATEEIIKEAAMDEGLFSTDGELDLELDEDIETKITVEKIEGSTVKIKFVAKGYVRVNVNEEEIQEALVGKSWIEGQEALKNFRFSDKESKVEFTPQYFPGFLRRFPSNKSRIIINTELVEILKEEIEED